MKVFFSSTEAACADELHHRPQRQGLCMLGAGRRRHPEAIVACGRRAASWPGPSGRSWTRRPRSRPRSCRRGQTALPGPPYRRLRPRLDQHQRLEVVPGQGHELHRRPQRPGWVRWVCQKFKANPITDVQLGKVFAGPRQADGPFRVALKDGEILQGDLPFQSRGTEAMDRLGRARLAPACTAGKGNRRSHSEKRGRWGDGK